MELEIKKYLAFIGLIMAGFLAVHYTLINLTTKSTDMYWTSKRTLLSSLPNTTPKITSLEYTDGKTTIRWMGLNKPVSVEKSESLTADSWQTISKDNISGNFVDENAAGVMAFYRLSYIQ